jgi:pyruvate formate lyase activating enzyme
VDELLKDSMFYAQSNGGITLSGGEPFYQPGFSLAILKECKKHKLHTAVETCLHCKDTVLKKHLELIDLFSVDLKIFDAEEHRKYIGMDNSLIKENFEYLASTDKDIIVRIPLIPKITASRDNISRISEYVYRLNRNIPIELMNYNPLAENKYRLMGKKHSAMKGMKPFNDAELDGFYKFVENTGARTERETSI